MLYQVKYVIDSTIDSTMDSIKEINLFDTMRENMNIPIDHVISDRDLIVTIRYPIQEYVYRNTGIKNEVFNARIKIRYDGASNIDAILRENGVDSSYNGKILKLRNFYYGNYTSGGSSKYDMFQNTFHKGEVEIWMENIRDISVEIEINSNVRNAKRQCDDLASELFDVRTAEGIIYQDITEFNTRGIYNPNKYSDSVVDFIDNLIILNRNIKPFTKGLYWGINITPKDYEVETSQRLPF